MSNKNPWWNSPTWLTNTGLDSDFNEGLLDEIYSIGKNIQTGKEQPKHDLWDYDLPHIQKIKKVIYDIVTYNCMRYVEAARETEGLDIDFEYDFAWVNVLEPGRGIDVHAHSDSTVTATYYIKTPKDCGDLLFNDIDRTYEPKEGYLAFFPSYIMHEVLPNKSDDLRISLSTDLRHVVNPDTPNAVTLKSWVNSFVKIREWKCSQSSQN